MWVARGLTRSDGKGKLFPHVRDREYREAASGAIHRRAGMTPAMVSVSKSWAEHRPRRAIGSIWSHRSESRHAACFGWVSI